MGRYIRYNFKNTSLAYPDNSNEIITLRLTEPALHGDFKDFSRKPVPVGKYRAKVCEIFCNFYGQYVRIQYDNRYHDIAIGLFEWHKEDQ